MWVLTWVRESDPRCILYELIFEVGPNGVPWCHSIRHSQNVADDPHGANGEQDLYLKRLFVIFFSPIVSIDTHWKQVEDSDLSEVQSSLRFKGWNWSVEVGQVLRKECHHGDGAESKCPGIILQRLLS